MQKSKERIFRAMDCVRKKWIIGGKVLGGRLHIPKLKSQHPVTFSRFIFPCLLLPHEKGQVLLVK